LISALCALHRAHTGETISVFVTSLHIAQPRNIMTTASKFKTVKTPTARAAAPKEQRNTDAHTQYAERMAHVRDEYLASQNVPSGVRLVVAAVSRLLAFSVSIYWGLEASAILMTAAIALTGSGFIAFVIGLTALLLAFSAAWQAGSAVGNFILTFNFNDARDTGRDLRIAAAKRVNLVKGWFKRDDAVADPIAV